MILTYFFPEKRENSYQSVNIWLNVILLYFLQKKKIIFNEQSKIFVWPMEAVFVFRANISLS